MLVSKHFVVIYLYAYDSEKNPLYVKQLTPLAPCYSPSQSTNLDPGAVIVAIFLPCLNRLNRRTCSKKRDCWWCKWILCNLGAPAKHRSTLLADTWSTYGWRHWPTLDMSSCLQVDMSADYQSKCQSTSVGPVSICWLMCCPIVDRQLADISPDSVGRSVYW